MSAEHDPIQHHDPKEGFDRAEPAAGSIALFAIGSLVLLILTIVAIQVYFEHIWQEAVYEKVLKPKDPELMDLRNRESWNMTHYGYMDQKSGVVRIPVDKAMDMVMKDAADGKTFYPAKPTMPKPDPAAAPAMPAAGPVPGTNPAAPGAAK
jgi:hypothetical protein